METEASIADRSGKYVNFHALESLRKENDCSLLVPTHPSSAEPPARGSTSMEEFQRHPKRLYYKAVNTGCKLFDILMYDNVSETIERINFAPDALAHLRARTRAHAPPP